MSALATALRCTECRIAEAAQSVPVQGPRGILTDLRVRSPDNEQTELQCLPLANSFR
jgi:hypothetical protein